MALAGRIKREIIGIAEVVAGLFAGLSLFTYSKWDASMLTYRQGEIENYGGRLGAWVADLLMTFFGLAAFAFAALLVILGMRRMLGMARSRLYVFGAALFMLGLTMLLYMFNVSLGLADYPGGIMGRQLGRLLLPYAGVAGTYAVGLVLFVVALVIMSPEFVFTFLGRMMKGRHAQHLESSSASKVFDDISAELAASDEAPNLPAPGSSSGPELEPGSSVSEMFKAFREGLVKDKAKVLDEPIYDSGAEDLLNLESPMGDAPRASYKSRFKLPPLGMLKKYSIQHQRSAAGLQAEADMLESRLAEFNVKGSVAHIHAGPVVTLFEFEPAAGVKMNKVISLADDLALGLKAISVRISAIPGKSTIGIEIPNARSEIVSLNELIASESFTCSSSKLTLAMGKDIFGKPVVANLARMPHLLVAGATGSGKSVFINAVIMSILYNAGPDEVKMMMIDPKLLELSVYDGIPHLMSPVVTSPKDASEMLRRMVFEMERRYRVLADRGVRNIDSFNAAVPDEERLPYIIVIIDELADLMLSSAAQVEDSIARLAQMARAAGIHLILATQRPSVDVITGVIKANFPARVAFQVSSGTDSRTIIGSQGAEQLIGRGDMLFMLPGVKMMRVHGALVTEHEVNEVVRFVKAQGAPDYTIIEEIASAESDAKADAEYSEERDELFWRAVEMAEAATEVSISSIQRKLKIGYNRAARIMEIMEEDGMVGPPKGAGKPRDFLGRGRM